MTIFLIPATSTPLRRPPASLCPTGRPHHAPTRFTGSLLDLGDGGQAVLQRLAAHRLQLADVVVGPAVAAAHLGAELALADPLGEALAHGVAAVEAVPAGRVLLAAAGVPLARGADEAAVAAVGDVAAGAAGAGALGDIAAGRALGSGSRELRGARAAAEGQQEQRAQQRHPHPRRAAGGESGGEGVRARPARGEAAAAGEGAIAAQRGKGKSGFMPTRAGEPLLPRAGLLQAEREKAADGRKEAGARSRRVKASPVRPRRGSSGCSPGLARRAEAPSHGQAAAQGERRPQAAAGSSEDRAERSGRVICGTRPETPPPPPAAAAGAPRRQQRRPGPTPTGEGRLPAGGPLGRGGPG